MRPSSIWVRWLCIVCCICLASCKSSGQQEAENDLPQIRERGELVALTLTGSTSYFNYRGEPMGFQYELAGQFAHSLGLKLKLKVVKMRPNWCIAYCVVKEI